MSLPADLPGWLRHLEQLHPKSIALGLDRVRKVGAALGLTPSFPLIVVGGTNGKGSTCAMLERVYLEAGYRVACYTSPHLLRYNERVRLNGEEAADEALCHAFAAVEAARENTSLTYFEFGTLAAMAYFMRCGVDVAILEVGLGGRLDAVNLFEPNCAIITSIDLDHQEYLGSDRASIGREKAGIFRRGVVALCGDPSPPPSVPQHADNIGATLRQVGRDFGFQLQGEGWDFASNRMPLTQLPLPALNGLFQLSNAACALEAIAVMQPQLPVGREPIIRALKTVSLPGRFQRCGAKPEIILDVAHNPHAAKSFAQSLRATPSRGNTVAVFAMLGDKDIAGVIRIMAPVVNAWQIAPIPHLRGATLAMLQACFADVAAEAQRESAHDVATALRQACLRAGDDDRIIVFGSFYTVADAMSALDATLKITQDRK